MLNSNMLNLQPTFAFDLISDLYLDYWPEPIDWAGLPTSLIGVVAGDLSEDLDRTVYELHRIGQTYRQVLYIDGDLEHAQNLNNVNSNRNYLYRKLRLNDNINYLHEHTVIINNVAFVAANLWWSPGDTLADRQDQDWIQDMQVLSLHHADLEYLRNTIHRLQQQNRVSRIVVISHTVPNTELIACAPHSPNLAVDASDYVEVEDTHQKISHWCFGHWPRSVNYTQDHCTYVSNPRGKPADSSGLTYYPLRVEV
jgi:hypothetical protein